MIPVSVSDILKILDQIPIWKALTGLPKRLTDLEARIAALEKRDAATALPAAKPVPGARICPVCESTMKVVREKPHPFMAPVGLKVHEMECPSCGNKAERDFDGQKYA